MKQEHNARVKKEHLENTLKKGELFKIQRVKYRFKNKLNRRSGK